MNDEIKQEQQDALDGSLHRIIQTARDARIRLRHTGSVYNHVVVDLYRELGAALEHAHALELLGYLEEK